MADLQRLNDHIQSGNIAKLGDRLVDEFNNVWSKDPEAMAAKGWYSKMTPLFKEYLGDDTELFVKLLAATSPGQNPLANFDQAAEALRKFKAGDYNEQLKAYKAGGGKITKEMQPRKDNGSLYYYNSNAVLKVLADDWKPDGPKTPNFNKNLMGTLREATIDRWAGRTLHRLAGSNLKIGNEGVSVSNLDFAIGQHAFRYAADKLGMHPDDLQAIAWYGEKKHYVDMGWDKKAKLQDYEQPFKQTFGIK